MVSNRLLLVKILLLEKFIENYNNLFIFIAPVPASVQTILGTVCKDVPGSFNDTTKWVYSRGLGKCETIHQTDLERHDIRLANQIVFVFQVIFEENFFLRNEFKSLLKRKYVTFF